jgi:uncharacterized protein (TIGR01777 family)
LKVAIAGSTGFVGTALVSYLKENDVEVVRLVRRSSSARTVGSSDHSDNRIEQVSWDPETDYVDIDALETTGVDAIVNLAGENVHQRWNQSSKRRMMVSRVRSTKLLGRTILQLKKRPRVFISASGISYYNDIETVMRNERGHVIEKHDATHFSFDESSKPGSGFLSELCQEWERASDLGVGGQTGVRTVNLRIGITLGATGGVLKKLLPIFKLGLGGKWGDGLQLMSWIGIDDLVRIIHFAIITESIEGPVNAVTPNPVTNLEFVRMLGRILRRPVILTVPGWIARLVFGKEWVESTLLADCTIIPAVLVEKGYKFKDPDLEPFLTRKLSGN